MQDSTVIRFVDVHKAYSGASVLNGLSLEVRRGRTLGIMGPSGTGKSVTLRHIIGLTRADSGQVLVEDRDVAQLHRKEMRELRRRMGYVFQEGALINWLSVEENVALPLRESTSLSEEDISERVQAKLKLVHIGDTGSKMPSEISGGMKKRVGLARALITDPELILYDEPNAGLDPEIARSINRQIRELSQKLDVTAIVVEHRIDCIRAVADEVIFLDEGRALVHAGSPEEFFESDHPRLLRFFGEAETKDNP
ncbi:MAG: ABC transporter ATP-binding protein [Planctomycetes bacterium]|nr:ABC transporter ATP-binding protein [Planctomycetota bacterium]MDP6408659.1 ATP-binding cassette domain-containing protein [Planctomycetota bacterium]